VAAFATLFVRKLGVRRILLHEPGFHFVHPALVYGAKALEDEAYSRHRANNYVELEPDRNLDIVSCNA
jgi:hypothetical protein